MSDFNLGDCHPSKYLPRDRVGKPQERKLNNVMLKSEFLGCPFFHDSNIWPFLFVSYQYLCPCLSTESDYNNVSCRQDLCPSEERKQVMREFQRKPDYPRLRKTEKSGNVCCSCLFSRFSVVAHGGTGNFTESFRSHSLH